MRDRFLAGILIGIGVLVFAALILFFTRQAQVSYGDDGTPAGALKNYFLALQNRDYERAYGYLASQSKKSSLNQFRQSFLTYQGDAIANAAVEVGETLPDGQDQTAVVQVTLWQGTGDLFGTPSRSQQTATLVREGEVWKISEAPYPYWSPELPVEAPPKALPPTPTPGSAPP
jgi:hypothetical protein